MKYAFVLIYLLLISSCASQDIDFEETGVKSTLEETLDLYLEANISPSSPGMAILVIKEEDVLYSGAKGLANKNTGRLIEIGRASCRERV